MDPSSKTADEPNLDLYTIPSRSSWFSWADIHETEKQHLPEFFDGASITRTPKVYKEYRDFIISKYRECPSRRLTFSEVRKSLVGDVTVLHKVFRFLDSWGLINFSAGEVVEEGEGEWTVKVEEGPPVGVRAGVGPSGGRLTVPLSGTVGGGRAENGSLLAPLASFKDVYGDEKGVVCSDCKEQCDSARYQCVKEEGIKLCIKCFKNGKYGKNYSADDFKLIGDTSNSENNSSVWTEAETLLLLESVMKHGENWDLVAENFKTKSKADCISKLIQLPFGDLMLGSAHGRGGLWNKDSSMSTEQQAPSEPHVAESVKTEDKCTDVEKESDHDGNAVDEIKENGDAEDESKNNENVDDGNKKDVNAENEGNQNGDGVDQLTPSKRKRDTSSFDAGSSLMKQVSLLSSVVDPRITASAADAALSALCDEIQCPIEVFDDSDTEDEPGFPPSRSNDTQVDGMDVDEKPTINESERASSQKNVLPLSLQMRAATATALGAAAARAKLLADQEDREVEALVANIIETQMKKVQHKIKYFDDIEMMMEKQHTELENLKESILVERVNVLQSVFEARISKSKDQTLAKSHGGSNV